MGLEALIAPVIGLIQKALVGRPSVEIVPERFGSSIFMKVKVTNNSRYVVELQSVSAEPPLFEVWADHSVEGVVAARIGKRPSFHLQPDEAKHLPILALDKRDEHADHVVDIVVRWRSLRRPRWPQPPVKLSMTHCDFERLKSN